VEAVAEASAALAAAVSAAAEQVAPGRNKLNHYSSGFGNEPFSYSVDFLRLPGPKGRRKSIYSHLGMGKKTDFRVNYGSS
jgi:hypothetical protein